MAIGIPPSTPENWGRWPHQQPAGPEYGMMEAGMVAYDSRTGTTAQIQRPGPPQHFVPGHYNPAPMPSNPPPQYQAPVIYGGYAPYSPPHMLDAPYKCEPYLERQHLPAMPVYPSAGRGIQNSWDGLPSADRSQSPSVKSESSQMSMAESTSSESSTSPKVIIPNVQVHGAPLHESKTQIDGLVGVLQAKFTGNLLEKGEQEETCEKQDERTTLSETQQGCSKAKPKQLRFICDIPGCSKRFAQKNNLDTHRRAHTGEKPYKCPYASCCRGFTQGINLKTHINRHLGLKPYNCELCGKTFAQRSNVKAHMKTHAKVRVSFVCKLDGCNKTFTAKGNLKTHQNAFHRETVLALTAKFATITDESSLTKEEMELIKYLMSVHNNANKGIKGRGKGRKVKRILPPQPYPSPMSSPATSPVYGHNPFSVTPITHAPLPQLHTPPPPPPQQPTHPFHGLSSPPAYTMGGRHHTQMHFGMPFHHARDVVHGGGGYDMMESDVSSPAGSSQASSPMHHQMYEDEQERDLVFADRMY